jgi:hypothetical protein
VFSSIYLVRHIWEHNDKVDLKETESESEELAGRKLLPSGM